MKSTIIIPALAFTSSALTSAVSLPRPSINALAARLVDPATMDPTRLSVLSVLRTGMPTAPNSPMPTGDYEPDWYQALPGDVKSLLPALYPVAAVVVAEAEPTATTSEVSVSQTPSVAETSAAGVKTFTDATMVSSSLSVSESPAPTSISSSTLSSAFASTSSSSSPEPWTSQFTLTKTLQHASPISTSTATPSALPLSSNLLPNTTTPATGSGVLPSASASFTNFLSSAGAKTSIRTETLAVIAWVSVGAGFFFFA